MGIESDRWRFSFAKQPERADFREPETSDRHGIANRLAVLNHAGDESSRAASQHTHTYPVRAEARTWSSEGGRESCRYSRRWRRSHIGLCRRQPLDQHHLAAAFWA